MASKQAFLPVATEETNEYVVPMYSPDGPDQGSRQEVAVASGSAVAPPPAPGAGRNHIYCNFCCDCRRAVLAVNAISIIWKIIMLVIVNILLEYMNDNREDVEANMSDADKEEFENLVQGGNMKIIELIVDILTFISIAFHACGIYGALKFKKWAVAVGGSAYAIWGALALIQFRIVDVILAAALGYPHYFLIKEINEGIMTDYNYHNVASCCGGA